MPTFVLSYRTAHGFDPSPETRQAWWSWFDGMGDSLVDLGRPVLAATSVGVHDAETTRLGGYSLVTADDLEGAVTIAKNCPALTHGGGVEVGELGPAPDRISARSDG